jgi:excisionase family DNA binding protein
MENEREYLIIDEFAAKVRLSRRTICRLIAEGKIKASKPVRKVLIHVSEVEKFMKRSMIVV